MTPRPVVLAAALTLLAAPPPSRADTAAEEKARRIDALVEAYRQIGQFNGSVLVSSPSRATASRWSGPGQPERTGRPQEAGSARALIAAERTRKLKRPGPCGPGRLNGFGWLS